MYWRKRNILDHINIPKVHEEFPISPSTYTLIYGLFDDLDNSKQQNFELCHCSSK